MVYNNLTIRVINKLQNDYVPVVQENYLGFITRESLMLIELEKVIAEGRGKSPRSNWRMGNLHIKKLGTEESELFPPKRFVNALSLYDVDCALHQHSFIQPLAILYEGNLTTIATRSGSIYYVTPYVEGRPFIEFFKQGRLPHDSDFTHIGEILADFREQGHVLLDLAPRDIITTERYPHVVFADTENLEVTSDLSLKSLEKMKDKQMKRFRRDYKLYARGKSLDRIVKSVFQS